ncbi:right-handed parallel beta-helix repeat-containing protein [bacterium]|nr:right-handed parallel beta-helix repeat-containing protein [bacterium]
MKTWLLFLVLALAVASPANGGSQFQEGTPTWDEYNLTRDSEILFFDDMESGTNGWTTVDNTVHTPYFHLDTYLAYEGTYSWWCGTFDYDTNGGYGNSWDERLELPALDISTCTTPVLTFDYRYDVELVCDLVYVQVYSGGAWINLNGGGWDGSSSGWQYTGDTGYPLGAYGPTCDIRFRFVSDGGWSDEDGIYMTNGGACMFDNIRVYDYPSGTPIFFDDGESGGLCTPAIPPAAGDYWHIIDRACPAYSGQHSWWCGDDADTTTVPPNLRNSLISPPIDISTMTEGRLFYRNHLELPNWYQGRGRMRVTTDGGGTWYNVFSSSFWGDFGSCAGWSSRGVGGFDLTPYLPGSELQFKLTMETEASGNPTGTAGGSGIMFDDFMVVRIFGDPSVWHVPGDFSTIQEAVDRAVPGDVIEVGDGIYPESVYVGKSDITLIAGSSPIIDLGKTSPLDPSVGSCLTIGSYAAGVTVDGFTLRHGDNGIRVYPDNVIIKNCTIYENYGDGSTNYNHGMGIFTDGSNDSEILNNHIYDNSEMGVYATGERFLIDGNVIHDNGGTANSSFSYGLLMNATLDCVVSDNAIFGHTDFTGTRQCGVYEYAVGAYGNNSYTDNVVYGNEYSMLFEGGPNYASTVHNNSFYLNTAGMTNVTIPPAITDATNNWWGDSSGPYEASGNPGGTGDTVYGLITYNPWLTAPTNANIVCNPQVEYVSIDEPTCTIDIDYLGGGGGLMYGYSLKITWDNLLVTTDESDVTEGTLLSSEGSTFFYARNTGANEITIDGMLLGDEPGVTGPGTMFSVEFTAQSAVAYGTSPVNVTIDRIRDKDNNVLSGFIDDDGEIVVDTVAPVVTNVFITNNTLSHTDHYVKNGDSATVTADVTDGHPAFDIGDIVADLSGLGGGSAVTPDTYTGGVATWNLSSVTCNPANGTVTVTVTAEDDQGNSASDSDDIIADNTAPTAVTGFDAAPAHEECVLSWTNGTDTYYVGTVVRRESVSDEYPQYPWFVANWSSVDTAYPTDETDGTGVYDDTGTSYTDGVVPRNIYYYQAFCYDIARNYGPAVSTARDLATNYWLGDVADGWSGWGYDGLVDDGDILQLSGVYWQGSPTGNAAECDVGPTVHPDWHRLGLPLPDDMVEFEDAMIFAMNYGVVAPRVVPFLPEPYDPAPLALALGAGEVRSGDVVVALRLEGNSSEVKGLSASLAYDPNELEFVSARLSDDMVSPLGDVFFMHRADGTGVELDAVVLGTGVTIGGSGEVVVLTFHALSENYTLEVESARLRDVDNTELEAKLGDYGSGDELPLVFRLVGNTPNPFNPVTKIAYHVPHESEVTIRVYDVAGRAVTTLVDGVVDPGRHQTIWNGLNDQGETVGSGVYFCTMEAPDFHESRKMTLLK